MTLVNVQVNKEEDDKMRTTAANVAARAAVGGDDMLSKWQLMAEQARQKREGERMQRLVLKQVKMQTASAHLHLEKVPRTIKNQRRGAHSVLLHLVSLVRG